METFQAEHCLGRRHGGHKRLGLFRIPSTPVLLETEFSLNVSNYEMFSPF